MLDDPSQHHILVECYPDDPSVDRILEWNGHVLNKPGDIINYLKNLPKTKHLVECVDAQPLPGNTSGDCFLLVCSGKVTYDEEHTRTFYHRFVIRQMPNEKRFYILNEYFRWTGEVFD
eukprot:GFYU01047718.1.p1 GENE.GFYU01047718.1~~GFYU01047718.1.p1  ORF type:complete len:129 (+),score=29.42 GFYU01047718.1:34-387(+)